MLWESQRTHNAAVPRRYMQLVWLYARLSQAHAAELETRERRLAGGVGKLQEAKRLVDQLKQSAAQKSEELARAQESADQVLQQIANSMSATGTQKTEMEALRKDIAEESAKLEKRKRQIDAEVADVMPVVQAAKSAVGQIRSEQLAEIRALRAPPDVIRDVLEGALCSSTWSTRRTRT